MKGLSKWVFAICLATGLIMGTNTVFKQFKHPEIIIDHEMIEVDGLGFGDPGKHPEIVELTSVDNLVVKAKTVV